jgi:hypothetical protein
LLIVFQKQLLVPILDLILLRVAVDVASQREILEVERNAGFIAFLNEKKHKSSGISKPIAMIISTIIIHPTTIITSS